MLRHSPALCSGMKDRMDRIAQPEGLSERGFGRRDIAARRRDGATAPSIDHSRMLGPCKKMPPIAQMLESMRRAAAAAGIGKIQAKCAPDERQAGSATGNLTRVRRWLSFHSLPSNLI